jgi:hypothetical protein
MIDQNGAHESAITIPRQLLGCYDEVCYDASEMMEARWIMRRYDTVSRNRGGLSRSANRLPLPDSDIGWSARRVSPMER